MKRPITPERLEELVVAYVMDVKREKSTSVTLGYIQKLRDNLTAVDWYHERNPGERDREKDYILAAAQIKRTIDEDYR